MFVLFLVCCCVVRFQCWCAMYFGLFMFRRFRCCGTNWSGHNTRLVHGTEHLPQGGRLDRRGWVHWHNKYSPSHECDHTPNVAPNAATVVTHHRHVRHAPTQSNHTHRSLQDQSSQNKLHENLCTDISVCATMRTFNHLGSVGFVCANISVTCTEAECNCCNCVAHDVGVWERLNTSMSFTSWLLYKPAVAPRGHGPGSYCDTWAHGNHE